MISLNRLFTIQRRLLELAVGVIKQGWEKPWQSYRLEAGWWWWWGGGVAGFSRVEENKQRTEPDREQTRWERMRTGTKNLCRRQVGDIQEKLAKGNQWCREISRLVEQEDIEDQQSKGSWKIKRISGNKKIKHRLFNRYY